MNVKKYFTTDKVLKISLLCFSCMILLAIGKSTVAPDNQLSQKQAHLAVRAIGDVLLSNANDFSSPVQPVEEIDEHTLRLSFKDPIPINPDSLSLLAIQYIDSEIADKAIVNVLEAESEKMVYGFEINHINPKEIPCLGRNLPVSNYYLDFGFYRQQPTSLGLNAFTFSLLGFIFVAVALLGVSFFNRNLQKPVEHNIIQAKGLKLHLDTNQIVCNDSIIKLTNKEVQIFSILLEKEGQLVSREHLIQEVWLKEGVVTGRSLDMYISRLRKKILD
ncbi:MAG: winged helix-turn-helix domain-containing protein, partial [Bacteroidota bacterium]